MGSIRAWRRGASFAVLATVAFAALGGCKKDGDVIGGSTVYDFIHRACDELHAYNYKLWSSTDTYTGNVHY